MRRSDSDTVRESNAGAPSDCAKTRESNAGAPPDYDGATDKDSRGVASGWF